MVAFPTFIQEPFIEIFITGVVNFFIVGCTVIQSYNFIALVSLLIAIVLLFFAWEYVSYSQRKERKSKALMPIDDAISDAMPADDVIDELDKEIGDESCLKTNRYRYKDAWFSKRSTYAVKQKDWNSAAVIGKIF
jgi:hypothetical protein